MIFEAEKPNLKKKKEEKIGKFAANRRKRAKMITNWNCECYNSKLIIIQQKLYQEFVVVLKELCKKNASINWNIRVCRGSDTR